MDEELDREVSKYFEGLPAPPTERAARYLEMRKIGMALNARIQEVDGLVHPLTAARAMGIPCQDKTIVFDGEWEMGVLSEYSYYFHLSKGRRHIDRVLDGGLELSTEERTFLKTQKRSFVSVFETTEVRPETWEVDIVDRLGERGTLTICDRNWSMSSDSGILSYVRILPFQDFSSSSGVSLPLWVPGSDEKERGLIMRRCLSALRTPGKRTPAHSLFRMCRQLHLRSGLQTDYR